MTIGVLAAQQPSNVDTVTLFDLAGTLASASPPLMLAIFIFAMLRGWLVLPREITARDKRIMELKEERDEYKLMAFRAVGLGERVASAAEQRRQL